MSDTTTPESFKTRVFNKGETLVRDGEKGDDVFLIVKGKVEVRKALRNDRHLSLGFKEKGEIIGEFSAFDDQPHVATVVALDETVVTVMTRAEFQRRVATVDPIVRNAVFSVVRRARDLIGQLVEKAEPIRLGSKR
ncbi:MAG: cyclic nucleotide-binding domain-containing protein [Acidimicrobiia bacterium]|nr:cyclic nucleotide-binding domain-containing protein [Acidimicrobiia bacterium]